MTKKTIDILGSKWTVKKQSEAENETLKNCDGYCDWTVREIVVLGEKFDCSLGDKDKHVEKVMRHEIVHAFLFESGLAECSGGYCSWAQNETMVDWIARQGLKIYKAWQDAGCADVECYEPYYPKKLTKREVMDRNARLIAERRRRIEAVL